MRNLWSVFAFSLLAATTAVSASDEFRSAQPRDGESPRAAGPVGQYLGFMGEDDAGGTVSVYDWRVPPVYRTLVHTPADLPATVLAISPDGATLFVGDNLFNQVMALDTATLTFAAATMNAGGRPRGLAAGPTGRFLYVAVGPPDALTIIDLTGALPNQSIPLPARPHTVSVTPDNSYVVVTTVGGLAAVVNIGNPHTLRTYVQGSRDVAISPDSKRAVFPMGSLGLVSNVNLATLARTDWPTPGCNPSAAAFSPAGARLYLTCPVAGPPGLARRYSIIHGVTGAPLASGELAEPPGGPSYFGPATVSVTPDGRAAWFPGDPYGSIWVLDTTTLTRAAFLGGPDHFGNRPVFGKPFYEPIDPQTAIVSFAGAREAAPAACAAGQIFRVAARWMNKSAKAWTGVLAEVLALTGGNTLLEQTWDLTADGVAQPGEVLTGVFRIRLQSCAAFTFQVSLAGTGETATGKRLMSPARWASAAAFESEPPREEAGAAWALDPQ